MAAFWRRKFPPELRELFSCNVASLWFGKGSTGLRRFGMEALLTAGEMRQQWRPRLEEVNPREGYAAWGALCPEQSST